MKSQKHLFRLPADIHYLNCAYMSPLLSSVEEVSVEATKRLRNPGRIRPEDFFSEQLIVKKKFSRLINGQADQVAIIPSVSYGLKSAISNISVHGGSHAITISDEFPSDYYTIHEWCKANHKELKVVKAPEIPLGRGKIWTERILDSINADTTAVVVSAIHWMDGTRFDLEEIGKRCKEVNAMFIVDGSQSVGMIPIDVLKYKIDALICTGYKWLFGPYSVGLAYYSSAYDNGTPIENSWMNKENAEDFSGLTGYTDLYKKGAARFDVGESSHFILLPMLSRALDQILEWQLSSVPSYCGQLIQPLIQWLGENQIPVEDEKYRANHLFGFRLPQNINREKFLNNLQEKKIYVSVRGQVIRLSTHIFNTTDDVHQLLLALKN